MRIIGFDLDGVINRVGFPELPEGDLGVDFQTVCISGRTWAEYDQQARIVASQMPLYIRGTGKYGDREDAAHFKANMIHQLKVEMYYEDDPLQANIIDSLCADTKVVLVT